MIFGQINNTESYSFLNESIQTCLRYCKETDLTAMAPGCYPLQDKDIFVNIVSYKTGASEDRSWEAHREYLDIHVMLEGSEIVELSFIQKMSQGVYEPEKDYLPLQGVSQCNITLQPMDFLICYPEDGHKPGVAADKSEVIKKAIFKVRI